MRRGVSVVGGTSCTCRSVTRSACTTTAIRVRLRGGFGAQAGSGGRGRGLGRGLLGRASPSDVLSIYFLTVLEDAGAREREVTF